MSHGGMGGGGGHHGHHSGHGGVASGHHADQSAGWNMAMQVEHEHRKGFALMDPRLVVGTCLCVFVILISLPYTLDYFMSHGENDTFFAEDDGNKTPNAAALQMVGSTLMGGHTHAPAHENSITGSQHVAVSSPRATADERKTQSRYAARSGNAENSSDDNSGQSYDATSQQAGTDEAAASLDPNDAPAQVSKSADETVTKMLAASGMAGGSSGASSGQYGLATANQSVPEAFGNAVQSNRTGNAGFQQAFAQGSSSGAGHAATAHGGYAAMPAQAQPAYGGAMPAANQQYYVYIPNQQFGQPNQAAPVMVPAPVNNVGSSGQQIAAVSTRASGYDQRNPFNPNTSAITSPLGMRHHNGEASVPMIPVGVGADGTQRFRVCVNR